MKNCSNASIVLYLGQSPPTPFLFILNHNRSSSRAVMYRESHAQERTASEPSNQRARAITDSIALKGQGEAPHNNLAISLFTANVCESSPEIDESLGGSCTQRNRSTIALHYQLVYVHHVSGWERGFRGGSVCTFAYKRAEALHQHVVVVWKGHEDLAVCSWSASLKQHSVSLHSGSTNVQTEPAIGQRLVSATELLEREKNR